MKLANEGWIGGWVSVLGKVLRWDTGSRRMRDESAKFQLLSSFYKYFVIFFYYNI